MKTKEIIFNIILISIYGIAIKNTATLFYIPGSEFSSFVNHIPQTLLPFVVLIEIAFLFMPFGLTSILFIITSYKKSPPIKPPSSTIAIISGAFPILAIVNNYTSGIFTYSLFLLIYGVIMAAFAFRLRMVGVEETHVSNEEKQTKQIFEGLCIYIMEHDSFRPPVPEGITPYTWDLSFNQGQRYYFVRNNRDLHQKIRKELYSYFKIYYDNYNQGAELLLRYDLRFSTVHHLLKTKSDPFSSDSWIYTSESVPSPISLNFFLTVILIAIILNSFLNAHGLNLYNATFLAIISIIMIYALFSWRSTKIRSNAGEKYNKDIKKVVQELINYGAELIKKEGLNPEDYPLKLRHNDYEGLKYERNGKNNYLGFFKNRVYQNCSNND